MQEREELAPLAPAAQMFESRPDFTWDYSGFVQAVPPVRGDEKRVSHHRLDLHQFVLTPGCKL